MGERRDHSNSHRACVVEQNTQKEKKSNQVYKLKEGRQAEPRGRLALDRKLTHKYSAFPTEGNPTIELPHALKVTV